MAEKEVVVFFADRGGSRMAEKEVVVFTMTGCPHCAAVKTYLSEKGVAFVERNVIEDDGAMQDFRARGFRGTPVTLIGDEAVVGLDRDRLDTLLNGPAGGDA